MILQWLLEYFCESLFGGNMVFVSNVQQPLVASHLKDMPSCL